MSHIHRVLDKAQRDGFVKRTAPAAAPERLVAPPPAARKPSSPESAPEPALGTRAAASGAALPSFGPQAPAHPAPTPVPNPVAAARARTAEPGPLHPLLVAALAPESVVAEQYRALRTHLAHSEAVRQYRALIVTSPAPGDGKTLTALNLALTMAQEFHRRVLVVDADLRKGRLHRFLNLPVSPGLCEVLTGEASLEEALVSLPEYHLTFLPAGGGTSLPTEMLGSGEMRRTLDLLRTQFDRIVLDTPPVIGLADVSTLASITDGVLMVVRAGRTARPAIDRALREIQPAPVVGLVLNDVEDLAPDYAEYAEAASPPRRLRLSPRRPA